MTLNIISERSWEWIKKNTNTATANNNMRKSENHHTSGVHQGKAHKRDAKRQRQSTRRLFCCVFWKSWVLQKSSFSDTVTFFFGIFIYTYVCVCVSFLLKFIGFNSFSTYYVCLFLVLNHRLFVPSSFSRMFFFLFFSTFGLSSGFPPLSALVSLKYSPFYLGLFFIYVNSQSFIL